MPFRSFRAPDPHLEIKIVIMPLDFKFRATTIPVSGTKQSSVQFGLFSAINFNILESIAFVVSDMSSLNILSSNFSPSGLSDIYSLYSKNTVIYYISSLIESQINNL